MPAEMVVDETLLAAFDQRYHAGRRSRRCTEPDEVRTASQPNLQSLSYLVFDGHRLVAAFAMRDDAEQWIEDCGNRTMEVRERSAPSQPAQSKRRRAGKSNEKAERPVPRGR